jgi:hypothetical protein
LFAPTSDWFQKNSGFLGIFSANFFLDCCHFDPGGCVNDRTAAARSTAMEQDTLALHAQTFTDEKRTSEERMRALRLLLAIYRRGQLPDRDRGTCGLTPSAHHALGLLTNMLGPIIEETAQEVACRAGRWGASLADEALDEILLPRGAQRSRLARYRPQRGSFESWLRVVLWNLVRNRKREAQRLAQRQKRHQEQWQPPRTSRWPADLSHIDPLARFSDDDLARVRGWRGRLRVELLCLAGLWLKVPAETWERWLQEYEKEREVMLDRPFPPADFLELDDRKARIQPLAVALHLKGNTLVQNWKRFRDLLDTLDFIAGLRN